MMQSLFMQTGEDATGCNARPPPFSASDFITDMLVPGFRSGAEVAEMLRDTETARVQLGHATGPYSGRSYFSRYCRSNSSRCTAYTADSVIVMILRRPSNSTDPVRRP